MDEQALYLPPESPVGRERSVLGKGHNKQLPLAWKVRKTSKNDFNLPPQVDDEELLTHMSLFRSIVADEHSLAKSGKYTLGTPEKAG